MAIGLTPKPRGGWTITTTLSPRSAASTSSPSGFWLRPPVRDHGVAQDRVEAFKPDFVLVGAEPDGIAGQLFLGEPVLVLAAGRDQRVDERVPVLRGHP